MAERLRHWRTILHGRTVKALANHFGGPGSIPSARCNEREPGCEIFAPVPDAALNGCELPSS